MGSRKKHDLASRVMRINGQTPEGRFVVGGIFQLYSSVWGLALSDVIDEMWQLRCVIDWSDFLQQALSSGMKRSNVVKLIRGGFGDSVWCDIDPVVIERFGGREEVVPQGSHKP